MVKNSVTRPYQDGYLAVKLLIQAKTGVHLKGIWLSLNTYLKMILYMIAFKQHSWNKNYREYLYRDGGGWESLGMEGYRGGCKGLTQRLFGDRAVLYLHLWLRLCDSIHGIKLHRTNRHTCGQGGPSPALHIQMSVWGPAKLVKFE